MTDEGAWWTAGDAAAHCGISARTWQNYVTSGHAPPPDHKYGRINLWKPETVRQWHAARPGPGRWGPRSEPAEE